MDITILLTYIIGLGYMGATIYVANLEDIKGEFPVWSRVLLTGLLLLTLLSGLAVLTSAFPNAPRDLPEAAEQADVEPVAAVANMALTVFVVGVGLALTFSPRFRYGLRRILGADASYNPQSHVHTTAAVMSLSVVSLVIGQLVFAGGISGLAEAVETTGIMPGEVLFTAILWVVVSLLGVGLALRRDWREVLARLGLRSPTREDVNRGIGVGLALLGLQIVVGIVWTALSSPEQLAEQTEAAQQISAAINSLPLVLLVSMGAAVGEEIFFRGAMQPVFGLWLSSLFFAAIHTQYTLTPASLLILAVSLGFGWVRQRHSTTAAVIAHFVYNFVPLSLALLSNALPSPS
jgi:membrane protease YdiL (CAAX protease family)